MRGISGTSYYIVQSRMHFLSGYSSKFVHRIWFQAKGRNIYWRERKSCVQRNGKPKEKPISKRRRRGDQTDHSSGVCTLCPPKSKTIIIAIRRLRKRGEGGGGGGGGLYTLQPSLLDNNGTRRRPPQRRDEEEEENSFYAGNKKDPPPFSPFAVFVLPFTPIRNGAVSGGGISVFWTRGKNGPGFPKNISINSFSVLSRVRRLENWIYVWKRTWARNILSRWIRPQVAAAAAAGKSGRGGNFVWATLSPFVVHGALFHAVAQGRWMKNVLLLLVYFL